MTDEEVEAIWQEHLIAFGGPMVRAILGDNKTQTRRVIKPPPELNEDGSYTQWRGDRGESNVMRKIVKIDGVVTSDEESRIPVAAWLLEKCKYKVGDRLRVQEGYQIDLVGNKTASGRYLVDREEFLNVQLTDSEYAKLLVRKYPHRPSPARFMYRSLSRILLEITDVRIEQVQDISEEDAIAEGCEQVDGKTAAKFAVPGPLYRFEKLWGSLYKADGHGWEVNEWVTALSFKRIES